MKIIGYRLIFFTAFIVLINSCVEKTKNFTLEEITLASTKANAFFDKSYNESLDRSPIRQSYQGIKKDYDKLDDISDENAKKEIEITKIELQYLLDSINPAQLDTQTKISYTLFKQKAENEIADFKWRFHNYPVNQMHGSQSSIPAFLINIHQIKDSSEAVAYISRLNGMSQYFDQEIENLKIREKMGIMPPKFVFPRVLSDCENILKGLPFESGEPSTLLADFQDKISRLDLPEISKYALISNAKSALLTSVKPAYKGLIGFLKEQETRATYGDGVWKFPEGATFYENALARTTTTNLTAEEIHQIGLNEVTRIHAEMGNIITQVGFTGSLQDFFIFLEEDEQFYFPDNEAGKQAYLDSATVIISNMKSRLDELFITKPKADLVVKKVEAFRENSAGKAFYQRPAPDGSRPGTYYANLNSTRNMPKYEIQPLAYHEGIPGHHMDRTIAQELIGIPKFRKHGSYTAMIEGWGLYSEYLPKEIGLYTNPYADYGRLAMELWRACRLVVDTGIHMKKWTREEGIAYYQTNTSGSDRDCERMVERHIVMASQATAYKIGMIKILELREMAKNQLGEKFDIREFHEVVLTSGAVPLNVLENLVTDWITSKS
ncbi:MAG: hypothetical protein ACJA08_000147 [Cyclobacteriaceae bacterium]|jgi:uncharacterized protein (DUF885 family)